MAGNEVILLNRGCMGEPYVIENVCFVGSDESVDITIEQGRIADVRSSEKSVAKASKTWVIPGLWDCHTHFTQWSYTLGRTTLQAGDAADLVLLDCDPSELESPEAMRAMPDHVLATMLAGCWTYQSHVSRL